MHVMVYNTGVKSTLKEAENQMRIFGYFSLAA